MKKKTNWQLEVTQIKTGIIQIQNTSNWIAEGNEIRGLEFKPDIVITMSSINEINKTDDDVVYGHVAYKISNDFFRYAEMQQNGNRSMYGMDYKHNGSANDYANASTREVEYDDGFQHYDLTFSSDPDTMTELFWIAIKYLRG